MIRSSFKKKIKNNKKGRHSGNGGGSHVGT
jgi:hypothetical protein